MKTKKNKNQRKSFNTKIICLSCKKDFETISSKKETMQVNVCSNCHYFNTGKIHYSSAEMVEKYNKKIEKVKSLLLAKKKEKEKK
jgi:ribosomal protein L31